MEVGYGCTIRWLEGSIRPGHSSSIISKGCKCLFNSSVSRAGFQKCRRNPRTALQEGAFECASRETAPSNATSPFHFFLSLSLSLSSLSRALLLTSLHDLNPFVYFSYACSYLKSSLKMPRSIIIVVAGLSSTVVARAYRTGTPSTDTFPTQLTQLPSIRVYETPSSVHNAMRAVESSQEELRNGIYHVLGARSRGQRTRARGNHIGDYEGHDVYHGLDSRMISDAPTITDASSGFQIRSESNTPAPSRNLVPHWNYRTHSIVAAGIFVGIVALALAVLTVLYFKKVKRFFQRRRRERKSCSPPKYSTVDNSDDGTTSNVHTDQDTKSIRDPWSFEVNRPAPPSPAPPSPPAIIVEGDQIQDSADNVDNGDSIGTVPSPRVSYEQEKVTVSQPEPQTPCKLRDSVQKPVIVVPLSHVASMTASMSYTTELSRTPDVSSQNNSQGSSTSDSSNGTRSRHSDPGPDLKRVSLLPRIQRSSSPLFAFDD